jgi:hypothetical protein
MTMDQIWQTFTDLGMPWRALGELGPKQTCLAMFFGFIFSFCLFATLAASRSVLVNGHTR